MSIDRKPQTRRERKISPARIAAFDVLYKIEADGGYSSILLPLVADTLKPRDRALCHEITLGVLRKMLALDRIIDQMARGKKLDTEVRIALRIGLYQLMFLDRVPDHSAIDESVSLAARAKKTSAKGLVNAILRNAIRNGVQPLYSDDGDKTSVETSHPEWLLERWGNQFGDDTAAKIAAANNSVPKMAFRLTKIGAGTSIPTEAIQSSIVDGCFSVERVTPEVRELADKGLIYFQDEGSQLVGQITAHFPGGCLLDVAAAPGSKTTQIASTGRFSTIVAGDLHMHRLSVLSDSCQRQGVDAVHLVQYNAENALPFADGSFDTVLLDAPCSGTGTIRHNPEIRYKLRESDIAELSSKQLKILNNASKLVAPGGRVVYSTCSLEREENEEVIDRFLLENEGWQKISPRVPAGLVTADGYIRTFPHQHETDGFFVAVLGKD